MAKDEIGGVWRTVGGRRIFIKDGEDLASAMERSGKFQKMVQKDQKLVKEIDDEADEFKRKENENWKLFLQNSNDNTIIFLKYDQDQHHEYDGVKAKYIEDEFNKRFGKTQSETTSYDPHKGTKFERKYDSVKEALDDPNGAFQEYLRKKEQPEAVKFENMLERHNVRTFADDIELQEMSKMTNKELVEFEKSKGGFKTSDNAEFARVKELYYETGLAKYKDKMNEILKKHNIR